jgi:hypothetical protein
LHLEIFLYDPKNPLLNLDGKKIPLTIDPWRNGGSGAGKEHIFKGGLDNTLKPISLLLVNK